jgi:hypothetical protein
MPKDGIRARVIKAVRKPHSTIQALFSHHRPNHAPEPSPSHIESHIDTPSLSRQLTVAEDNLLAQVVDAVQAARLAFQGLCSDDRVIHAPNSRDLLALDAGLQALGNIVELLNGIDRGNRQFEVIQSVLDALVDVSMSANKIPMANAMIADMNNVEKRFIDVRRVIAATNSSDSTASTNPFPPGEAMRICQIVKKYYSIMSEVLNCQILCVIASLIVRCLLTLQRTTIESVQESVNDKMKMIMAMRDQVEELKRMDKSLIMRTVTE